MTSLEPLKVVGSTQKGAFARAMPNKDFRGAHKVETILDLKSRFVKRLSGFSAGRCPLKYAPHFTVCCAIMGRSAAFTIIHANI